MSPYREPTPREPRPLPVLREEYDEATKSRGDIIFAMSFTSAGCAIVASIGIQGWAGVPIVAALGIATLCLAVAYWRGQRTIRRWRDQERRRIAEGEK